MPFLSAANPRINWTHNRFKGKVEASTIDAHYEPLPRQSVDPEQMKEDLQIDYDTTLFDQCIKDHTGIDLSNIRRTTKSTDLAIQAVDKTEHT
jgi:hypothetical protein